MLFALFFGAGNLIYPAYLGQQAGENWLISMPGFLLTGAGLPLLGVIAIGYSGSRDVEALASRVAPWYGVAFAASLYLAIGPLFAMPRTATVSFEIAVLPLIGNLSPNMAQAVFSLFFFGLTYWLSMSPGKLVDRIGKILTPALLLTIAVLVGYAALNPIGAPLAAQGDFAVRPMIKGILEGYGTMDALASLVFAIIVIDAVRAMGVDNRSDLLKTTAISGLMAAGCLAAVYLLIGYMGATSVAGIGLQENGALVLSKSAQYYFGLGGNLLLGVIVLLACLTTAVGLVTSCAEYFNRLCPGISYKTFVILLALTDRLFGSSRIVYFCTMMPALAVGLLDAYKTAFGFSETAAKAIDKALPLYSIGLGWIIPSLTCFALGCLLNAAVRKKS